MSVNPALRSSGRDSNNRGHRSRRNGTSNTGVQTGRVHKGKLNRAHGMVPHEIVLRSTTGRLNQTTQAVAALAATIDITEPKVPRKDGMEADYSAMIARHREAAAKETAAGNDLKAQGHLQAAQSIGFIFLELKKRIRREGE